jgi:hypothetical protein
VNIQKRIKDFHIKAAAFHSAMAAAHQECCEKSDMAEGEGEGGFHATAAQAHAEMGEYHCECLKTVDDELGKSFASRGSDEPMPTNISAVAPDVPAGVRMVPRFGQRVFESEPIVDKQFERIVKVD